jgi:4-aminobutyrate aminotransferase/4-aminobutyrate aminotransferase/(S)-3-amino-2-methylpropionate transaminase
MASNTELATRQQAAVPRGIATKGIYAVRAENATLWDADGKEYIDFAAGIAVVNTGHRHPDVMAAVREQLEAFTHTSFNVAPYESYIALAERLNALTPGDHAKKTLLVTTGVEAVENAVKAARHYTGRSAIVAFAGAFHGRTMMGMALTGKVSPYKKGFGPMPGGVFHVAYPKTYHGIDTAAAMANLKQLFASDVDAAEVAAIIVEPVQGEGGFYIAPFEFMKEVRALCDKHGILMIVDEIQTGIARTGKMFASEYAGIVPDMVTMAKGLGGGFPLSAVTGRAEVMDSAQVGGLGGTYAGSPVAVAAAHAVLDIIEKEQLCTRATTIGDMMLSRLKDMAKRNSFNCIGDVRGLGAMVAFEIVKDRETREPDAATTSALVAKAEENGLILLTCGPDANVVRILAPLTIPEAQAKKGMDILEASLAAVVGA